jgi:hypothetical protein
MSCSVFKVPLWVAATGLAVLYLTALLGYFRTQAHFIENQRGYLLGWAGLYSARHR